MQIFCFDKTITWHTVHKQLFVYLYLLIVNEIEISRQELNEFLFSIFLLTNSIFFLATHYYKCQMCVNVCVFLWLYLCKYRLTGFCYSFAFFGLGGPLLTLTLTLTAQQRRIAAYLLRVTFWGYS